MPGPSGCTNPGPASARGAQEQGENSVCEPVVVLGALLGSHRALCKLDAARGAGGTWGRLSPSSDGSNPPEDAAALRAAPWQPWGSTGNGAHGMPRKGILQNWERLQLLEQVKANWGL